MFRPCDREAMPSRNFYPGPSVNGCTGSLAGFPGVNFFELCSAGVSPAVLAGVPPAYRAAETAALLLPVFPTHVGAGALTRTNPLPISS